MVQKIFAKASDPICSINESYLASSWNALTQKVSGLANFIFSSLYAIYDFPRSTNPVTQKREFRWVPTFVERGLGAFAYPTLLQKSGRLVNDSDTAFGYYSGLVHQIGETLISKCPRKDLSYEFKVVENSQDNAWSLPGGKIAINLGLIRNLEEEKSTFGMNRSFTLEEKIAAVLSHEITHAAARHAGRAIELRGLLFSIFKVLEVSANFFLCKPFNNQIKELEKLEFKTEEQLEKIAELKKKCKATSISIFKVFDFIAYRWILTHCILCTNRSHEFEADKYGMHLIHKVGSEDNKLGLNKNSAESAVWLQHYFKKTARSRMFTGWLGRIQKLMHTHPSAEERLAANQKTWEDLKSA